MKRILIHAGGAYIGGMEIVLLDLMRFLKNTGIEPCAVISGWNDGIYIAKLKENEIIYFQSKFGAVISNPLKTSIRDNFNGVRSAPLALYELMAWIAKFKPDAIVQTGIRPAFVAMPFVSRLCNKQILYLHECPGKIFSSFRGARVADKCSRIVCVSEYVASGIRPYIHDPAKMVVVRNGISAPDDQALTVADRDDAKNGEFRVSLVGQVIERKRHQFVLAALDRIVQTSSNISVRPGTS